MSSTQARQPRYATAGGWYTPGGRTAHCLRILTEAGGQYIGGGALSRAVFGDSAVTIGRVLKVPVQVGLVDSRRAGNAWEWRRLWPVSDAVAEDAPQPSTKFAGPTPRCATAEEYRAWRLFARGSRPLPELGFCEDCTPDHQLEMKLQGRCENPHVVFIGCVAGFRRV